MASVLNSFQWPKPLTLAPYLNLESYQVQKVAAVGLASLGFFGLQFGLLWTSAAQIALTLSGVTLLAETHLERGRSDWFNPDINRPQLADALKARLIALPLLTGLITVLGFLPPQLIAQSLMQFKIKEVAFTCLAAPLFEEILFRGFVQERLEDFFNWVDRKVVHLSADIKYMCSTLPQIFLFGYVHIIGNQVISSAMKIFVFLRISILAWDFTQYKTDNQSLVSPLIVHSAQNTGVWLGLLGGARVQRLLIASLNQ